MQRVLCYIIFLALRLVKLTYKFEYRNEQYISDAIENSEHKSFILALWHQNILASILSHLDQKFSMIISSSKDGEYVANICENFGHIPVRGSSSKGGVKALINSIKLLKEGIPSAVAIDGPRGPLYNIKPGVFEMAKKAQVQIIPMTISSNNYWSFEKAWDKFRVPKPFSKIIIHYGEPISVPNNYDKNNIPTLIELLQQTMRENEEKVSSSFA
ncbi:conserved hypothetical protein [Halobacteriovorax marinus SJ]|uniref:DUF374 domain-containing protein n=1 Tax=Halobacteriovorax marinus (strain ATCC BAA-682 / DSM 15412 / SJ) TaxID=862908 RepID=E1WZF2_HALMS|nr:lysophospholipid acyltransferase family protein [Halobacteriovorax marinus]CBW27840.1 conserved hypothetical protein [Halobacteriovorax marinus SJ]